MKRQKELYEIDFLPDVIFGLINLSLKFKLPILKTYGVSGHGKSEVDSCGGAAFKNIITRAIQQGNHLRNPDQYVSYLKTKESAVYKNFYILSSEQYKALFELKNDTPKGSAGNIDQITKKQRILIDPTKMTEKDGEKYIQIFSSEVMHIDEITESQKIKYLKFLSITIDITTKKIITIIMIMSRVKNIKDRLSNNILDKNSQLGVQTINFIV